MLLSAFPKSLWPLETAPIIIMRERERERENCNQREIMRVSIDRMGEKRNAYRILVGSQKETTRKSKT
jgi:hypothetical protein